MATATMASVAMGPGGRRRRQCQAAIKATKKPDQKIDSLCLNMVQDSYFSGFLFLMILILQDPLLVALMLDWPSAERAKPRNALTAGSMGLR
jgi:hypothetical protein